MIDQDEMARLWAEALGVKKVSPEDNFFALGGHSLLAVKLITTLRERTGLGEALDLPDLFENPTLAGFHARLTALAEAEQGTL